MPEAIAKWFPESKRQLCLVHVQRNISQATRMRDRKEIMETDIVQYEGQRYRITSLDRYNRSELKIIVAKINE